MFFFSLLYPGPKCADYQPIQWISSAGGGRRAAAHRPTSGHRGGEDSYSVQIFDILIQTHYPATTFVSFPSSVQIIPSPSSWKDTSDAKIIMFVRILKAHEHQTA